MLHRENFHSHEKRGTGAESGKSFDEAVASVLICDTAGHTTITVTCARVCASRHVCVLCVCTRNV